ncbi:hypothetical protein [Skermanella sp. TT6]|nr:hypothetical protein [Skermanella sp. TT6]
MHLHKLLCGFGVLWLLAACSAAPEADPNDGLEIEAPVGSDAPAR